MMSCFLDIIIIDILLCINLICPIVKNFFLLLIIADILYSNSLSLWLVFVLSIHPAYMTMTCCPTNLDK